ncbi:MAG: sugar ABC transporter permease [Lachnospiraceae bacterium]|nr:sugar ABC transporter permease [Lachnospiraceae bacterium]
MIKLYRDGSSSSVVLISSILFNGLSQILYLKQYFRGIVLMLLEALMIYFAPFFTQSIVGLFTLEGSVNSASILINGIVSILLIGLYVAIYIHYIKAAMMDYDFYCKTGAYANGNQTLLESIQSSFVVWGIAPTVALVGFLVIVPLLFAILAAFTNLSAPANIAPGRSFNWVGFDNFVAMFGGQLSWSSAFVRVFLWTIVFAILSTALSYIGGLVLAYILHHNNFKFRPFVQTVLMLPYAIPAVISMLVWRTLLNGSFGVVNRTLMSWGFISEPISWLSDPFMAKVTCILISVWAGFSYFMLLLLTSLNTISPAIYDAAAVDGATRGQTIRRVIIPLLLKRTVPFIVLGFTQNLNNFTSIFFLTEGNPALENTTITSAGGTDTLITWIYNLTFNVMKFNYASVIIVVLCVILIPISIWQFRKTNIYREGR